METEPQQKKNTGPTEGKKDQLGRSTGTQRWLSIYPKALHLSPDATCDRFDTFLSFLHASIFPWGQWSYLFLNKEEVFFYRRMVCLFGSVAMSNDLDMTTEGERSGEKQMGV